MSAESELQAILARAAEIDAERAAAAATLAEAEQQLGSAYADGDTKTVGAIERKIAEARAVLARAGGALAVLAGRQRDAEQALQQQRLQEARAEVRELEAQALSTLRSVVAQGRALQGDWKSLEAIARRAGSIDQEFYNEFAFTFASAGHHPPDAWPAFCKWISETADWLDRLEARGEVMTGA